MNLIDTPFELLNPKDFDQVITELQAAKRELVEALSKACDAIPRLSASYATASKYRAIADQYEAKPCNAKNDI